ncbi:MAG: hypothetical protein EBT57_09305, partial [Verrucomicrobia bacterium]|nr:hypothetical protein [Verrucomicrobiota bacterium]
MDKAPLDLPAIDPLVDRFPHISIVACETVRDVDGLALSSRNVRLNPSDREAAAVISRALKSAQGESE